MSRKASKVKPLAVLSNDDRAEYARRHHMVLNKNAELGAANLYLELWQDMMIQKYGLPPQFDIKLDTGQVLPREEPHAQNGSG